MPIKALTSVGVLLGTCRIDTSLWNYDPMG